MVYALIALTELHDRFDEGHAFKWKEADGVSLVVCFTLCGYFLTTSNAICWHT